MDAIVYLPTTWSNDGFPFWGVGVGGVVPTLTLECATMARMHSTLVGISQEKSGIVVVVLVGGGGWGEHMKRSP